MVLITIKIVFWIVGKSTISMGHGFNSYVTNYHRVSHAFRGLRGAKSRPRAESIASCSSPIFDLYGAVAGNGKRTIVLTTHIIYYYNIRLYNIIITIYIYMYVCIHAYLHISLFTYICRIYRYQSGWINLKYPNSQAWTNLQVSEIRPAMGMIPRNQLPLQFPSFHSRHGVSWLQFIYINQWFI